MQSSHIREKPHEITGELDENSSNIEIKSFICSCVAGASESCKHVVAVLLLLNRYNNILYTLYYVCCASIIYIGYLKFIFLAN